MASEAEMASLELSQEKEKKQQSSNRSHQVHVQQQTLPCPRCHSLDTKFCYFNNYNLAQPRHYCRSCKRYWTHGGTLRDVPIGGASRKTHLSSSSNKRRRATESQATTPPPRNHPQMEIISTGVDVTSSGFFMGLGLGQFGFEVLPGFDALQGFGLDHYNGNTRAFWTRPEVASNGVMTTTAATASFTVSGGEEGPASAVDSPGVDRWRLEDALLQGGIDEDFNLSMSIPTKGLN